MNLEEIFDNLEEKYGDNVCLESLGLTLSIKEAREQLSLFTKEVTIFNDEIWIKSQLGKSINSNPIFSIFYESKENHIKK